MLILKTLSIYIKTPPYPKTESGFLPFLFPTYHISELVPQKEINAMNIRLFQLVFLF